MPRSDLGPHIYPVEHYSLLRYVLEHHGPTGTAIEFGVATGTSTRIIASHMPVIGFDGFDGLPTDWREGYPKGMFACDPPDIDNATLVIGQFDDTLLAYEWPGDISLVHFDADLYLSTATALTALESIILRNRPIVCFDEWHGYDTCEQHEQRAWSEFTARTGVAWTAIGHSSQQLAIKVN